MPTAPLQRRSWLVVGLGNPGPSYHGTRHNIGFHVVDTLARDQAVTWLARYGGRFSTLASDSATLHLLKPWTYMNRSGLAVHQALAGLALDPGGLIVIHDDVDLVWSRLQLKAGGSDGGHRGVQSVADELGLTDFTRVRIGIGRPALGSVTDHVLAPFTGPEQQELPRLARRAADAVLAIVTQGLTAAMNRFNAPPHQEAPPSPADG